MLYAVPYFIKKPVLAKLQRGTHKTFTTIFTNIGAIDLTPDAERQVRLIRAVNGDTRRYGLSVTTSCVTYNGVISICFSNANRDDTFFFSFVKVLEELGFEVNAEE